MLTCGLVILNYNDAQTTIKLLNHIKNFDALDYIVVVDNCSTDNSFEELKNLPAKFACEKIHVIKSERNGGYSYGNNFGAKYLIKNFKVDLLGISNPDVIFENDFVSEIKQLFVLNPDYAVISGKMELPNPPKTNKVKRIRSNLREKFFKWAENFNKGKMIYKTTQHNDSANLVTVKHLAGSLYFIRSDDFLAMGMFDENVFMYCEEDILSYKIQKLGKKLGRADYIEFIHEHNYGNENYSNIMRLKLLYYGHKSILHLFKNYICENKAIQLFYSTLANLTFYIWVVPKALILRPLLKPILIKFKNTLHEEK